MSSRLVYTVQKHNLKPQQEQQGRNNATSATFREHQQSRQITLSHSVRRLTFHTPVLLSFPCWRTAPVVHLSRSRSTQSNQEVGGSLEADQPCNLPEMQVVGSRQVVGLRVCNRVPGRKIRKYYSECRCCRSRSERVESTKIKVRCLKGQSSS